MGFWPLPPNWEPEAVFLEHAVEEDVDDKDIELLVKMIPNLVYAIVATPKVITQKTRERCQAIIVKALLTKVAENLGQDDGGWKIAFFCMACGRSCPWREEARHPAKDCQRVIEYNISRGGKAGWVNLNSPQCKTWKWETTVVCETVNSMAPRMRHLRKSLRRSANCSKINERRLMNKKKKLRRWKQAEIPNWKVLLGEEKSRKWWKPPTKAQRKWQVCQWAKAYLDKNSKNHKLLRAVQIRMALLTRWRTEKLV